MPESASDKTALRAFGAAVSELRAEHNMSVSQLATTAGTTAKRIEHLEAGQLDPPFDLMLAVADALNVRVSTIIFRASRHEQPDDL